VAVWAEADKEKSVDVQSIRLVLSDFELIAIGIQFGAFDYELIRRWNKSAILTYWRHGAPFVFALQAQTKNDAVRFAIIELWGCGTICIERRSDCALEPSPFVSVVATRTNSSRLFTKMKASPPCFLTASSRSAEALVLPK